MRKPPSCEWCQAALALLLGSLCEECQRKFRASLSELKAQPDVAPYDLEAEDFLESVSGRRP